MEAMSKKLPASFYFFSDADVTAPKLFGRLVPHFAQSNVGCLTCLPRGAEARTLGGKMIALHYGFNYLPQWMLAQRTTGIHFAIGHTMACRARGAGKNRRLQKFPNHLADDYEPAIAFELGLKVIVPPLLLDCVMPAESFGEAFTRMQRWTHHPRSRGKQFSPESSSPTVFWR